MNCFILFKDRYSMDDGMVIIKVFSKKESAIKKAKELRLLESSELKKQSAKSNLSEDNEPDGCLPDNCISIINLHIDYESENGNSFTESWIVAEFEVVK